ncbi:IclR family transcriptional regulator C-terminal domain-containing protein [Psychrobacter sp.]|uniref:IclR family transcriptional regulator n=1 Tax=Psychrobacter sp. TaxID=56811 RepID=UPI0028B23DBB|nr:IclR family transcriptional regulator C-terminal domain-containing protein [Psychrobacter sp.]
MPAAKDLIENPTSSKNQGGVQSLEIGLSVLDVLIDHNKPMMLKDIAQAMQMHPAKCHRYLVSLIRKNYALQLSDGRYGLGTRGNTLGHANFNQNNILERLTHIATEIKDTLNCAVQIAKWFSEGPIIIQSVEPDSPISIITRIGSRMPLTTSATGQLFASYQPDTIIKPLVVTEWQTNDRAAIAEQWQHFSQLKIKIRTQGYATVTGDMLVGINAIAIPVILPQLASHTASTQATTNGELSADNLPLEYAITIIGTTEQLPMSEQHGVVKQILAIAQRYQIA